MPEPIANPEAGLRREAGHPTYAAAFRCIGPACEDPCCGEWDIPLDHATYAKYHQFPRERLGSVVAQFVSITPGNPSPGLYAQIHRGPSGLCPFWDADRLCSIQKEYGPQLLSATCSIYPRSLSRVAGTLEGTLSLSCPEAARNVLLDPNFLDTRGDLLSGAFRTDNCYQLAHGTLQPAFPAIRALLIDMLTDRTRPLWERLLRIGALCQRLDAAEDSSIEKLLTDVRDRAQPELETWLSDLRLKLEVVLKLSDDRVREKTCGKRFRDTLWAFVEGVATSGDDIGCFLEAERKYYGPFFAKSPFILENYLLNYMLQNLFPFGREDAGLPAPHSMFDEFLLMATQFAWIDALLVGVSARHRDAFAAEHVIEVVQSLTREVEHYPPVLRSILETIKNRKLDTLQGMAILLRN